MCTMTWIREPEGYQLFFNRDELKTRTPAGPPEVGRTGLSPFVAPVDGDHGGTWIAANPHGLTLCLLNGYREADDDPPHIEVGRISRGLLVTSLADARSPAEVLGRVRAVHLEHFRSFQLAAFAPHGFPRYARWQNGDLETGILHDDAMPVVSSSFAPTEVVAARRASFAAANPGGAEDPPAAHLEFHGSHGAQPGPRSVCMHRDDAETVSFSRVVVDDRRVRFYYAPHAPHLGTPDKPAVTLDRV